MSDTNPETPLPVLVYSSDADTRDQVMGALGTRPHPKLPPLRFVPVATGAVVVQRIEAGGIALAILDGEAAPTGGLGLAKQLDDEIPDCPPLVVLTGRRDDQWLARWSGAQAAVSHPLDPWELTDTIVDLLQRRATAAAG